MTRQVLMVDLRDDPHAIATYRVYHQRVWPEVIDSLRRVGVEQLDIYILGRRLVMIVEVRGSSDFRSAFEAHAASSPRVAEWERLMMALQEPAPGAPEGKWWAAMEPVFTLNGQGTVLQ